MYQTRVKQAVSLDWRGNRDTETGPYDGKSNNLVKAGNNKTLKNTAGRLHASHPDPNNVVLHFANRGVMMFSSLSKLPSLDIQ